MPESKYPMIPVEEAQQLVLSHTPVLPAAPVTFVEGLGRLLAETVYATEDMPPFPASSVDGYAVVAADTERVRRLVGDQTAGYVADVHVQPGTVARITTGAPLPSGADAVVMVEFTEERDGVVSIQRAVKAGDNVRPPGQDIGRGDIVLAAGTLLGPVELGLLATIGRTEVQAYRNPRVAVMSTGNELVEPGRQPAPGQIRDANRYSLMAVVRQAGGIPIDLGISLDRPDELEGQVRTGLAQADVLLTSGGVSMGQLDLVKPLLERIGTVHFGRVNTKPGKPVTFATVEQKLVFALPGFPVSALVSFEIFVRPALLKLQGHTELTRPVREVVLAHDVRHDPERTEFQRAIVTRQDGEYVASTTGFQGSGRLLSLVGANALLRLPSGQGNFAGGQRVQALILGEIKNGNL